MNNKALKFSKELFFSSIRIQELMNQNRFPDEDFENQAKKFFYEKGKSSHKWQKGLVRISKYAFNFPKTRGEKTLRKNDIKIHGLDCSYSYSLNQNEDRKVWYVDFSDRHAFWNRGDNGHGQTDILLMEMPLLRKAARFIDEENQNVKATSQATAQTAASPTLEPQPTPRKTALQSKQPDFSSSVIFKDEKGYYFPTPILFEGIPCWLNYQKENFVLIPADIKTNVLSMIAPFGGKGTYTKSHIIFLLETLLTAFGGIAYRGLKDKKKEVELHTGNWGCGNFGNNKELIYLAQIFAASVMGFDDIYFHICDNEALNRAQEKFATMPESCTFMDAVDFFMRQGFEWR